MTWNLLYLSSQLGRIEIPLTKDAEKVLLPLENPELRDRVFKTRTRDFAWKGESDLSLIYYIILSLQQC